MADWPPLRGASFLAVMPVYDGSGSLVLGLSGATAPTASVYKDGGAGVSATCAVSELGANAGLYAFRLSAAEMAADVVAFKVSASSASARDTIGVLYTVTRQLDDLAFPTVAGNGLVVSSASGALVDALAASTIQASSFKVGAITNAALAASAIDNSVFAANAGSVVWNNAVRSITALNASAIAASTFTAGALDAAAHAASVLTACKFAAGAIDATALAASAITNGKWGVTATLTANPAASGITASSFTASAIDNRAWGVTVTHTANPAASGLTASSFIAGAIDPVAIAACAVNTTTFALNAASKIWDAAARTITGGTVSLAASGITASTLAANSIHAAAVAASTLSACKLSACTVDNAALSATVTSTLGASGITACTFAACAVDNAAFSATPSMSLGASSITASTLAAGAIHAAAVAACALSACSLRANTMMPATFHADFDVYQAKVWAFINNSASTDRYAVSFFKNGQPVLTGVASPMMNVVRAGDAALLFDDTPLAQVSSYGVYRLDISGSRMVSGSSYFARLSATIGGASRIWIQPVGRDA